MIDIKELRFGNYVSLTDPSGETGNVVVGGIMPDKILLRLPDKVTSVGEEKLNGIIISDWQHEDGFEINPIPLTEDLILKCGFKRDMRLKQVFRLGLIDLMHFGTWSLFDDREDMDFLDLPLEYLHQLQNLYFALTGKEIEVEL